MCNCVILDVTVKKILITAFLKKWPFLAKGLCVMITIVCAMCLKYIIILYFKHITHTEDFPLSEYQASNCYDETECFLLSLTRCS